MAPFIFSQESELSMTISEPTVGKPRPYYHFYYADGVGSEPCIRIKEKRRPGKNTIPSRGAWVVRERMVDAMGDKPKSKKWWQIWK
jgi:hypothetical protein